MTTRRGSRASQILKEISGEALSLGRFLESIRFGEEIPQVEFAKRLGVSRSHLCDIEKGRKTVSAARAARFARVLGYSETQFVRLALQASVDQAGLALTVRVENR